MERRDQDGQTRWDVYCTLHDPVRCKLSILVLCIDLVLSNQALAREREQAKQRRDEEFAQQLSTGRHVMVRYRQGGQYPGMSLSTTDG